MEDSNNWTKVISSKQKWFDFELRELWSYRDLTWIFVRRDIVSIYKQTILGPLWFLFGPLFTVFTYTFAFSTIANIPTDGIPAPVFYLAGTTLWNYFQACFNGVSNTFRSNVSVFGKVYFPRLVSPISLVISNLLKLGIQFITFLLFCLYYSFEDSIKMNQYVLLFPVIVLVIGFMSLGLGLIVSSFTVKYRDLNQIIGVFITLLMYATPIIYPTSSVPEVLKPYLSFNPLSPLIDAFRYAFTGAGNISFIGLLYSLIFSFCVLFIGASLFTKTEKDFVDTI